MGCPPAVLGVVIVGGCNVPPVSGKTASGDGEGAVTGAIGSLVAVSVGDVTSEVGAAGWTTGLVCGAGAVAGS